MNATKIVQTLRAAGRVVVRQRGTLNGAAFWRVDGACALYTKWDLARLAGYAA